MASRHDTDESVPATKLSLPFGQLIGEQRLTIRLSWR
jgi:hypothetical protein